MIWPVGTKYTFPEGNGIGPFTTGVSLHRFFLLGNGYSSFTMESKKTRISSGLCFWESQSQSAAIIPSSRSVSQRCSSLVSRTRIIAI